MTSTAASLRPAWDGVTRTIACHSADLDGTHVPNSLPAIEACVAAGAPRVEVDLRFLADDTMVVFHDSTLEPLAQGTGELGTLTFEDVVNVRYAQPPSPPLARFEQVVDAVRTSETCLQVDLKLPVPFTRRRVDVLCEALEPLRDRAIVGSQNGANLMPLAERGFKVAFDPTQHWHYWPGRPHGLELSPRRLGMHGLWDDASIAHDPAVPGIAYVNARIRDLVALVPHAAEWMVDLHTLRHLLGIGVPLGHALAEQGIDLAAWTIEDRGPATTRARITELFDLGATTIIARRAATVARYLHD